MKKEYTSRQALRAAALHIVETESLSAVSIRRVAEECGVASGTVYHYYPSKDELLADVLTEFWQRAFHGVFPTDSAGRFDRVFLRFFRAACGALGQFEAELLAQTEELPAPARHSGKLREMQILTHVRSELVRVLRADTDVDPAVWTDCFTPERFTALLVNEAVAALRRGDSDPAFLTELIARTLYSGPAAQNAARKD
jgi:AcrR family transcriptional regulator